VAFSNKKVLKSRALYWSIGLFTATIVGLLVWLNYGWSYGIYQFGGAGFEAVAVHTLGDAYLELEDR